MADSTFVQLQGIGKSYGNLQALSDVSLELGEGEVFGYIGPNGAGKTTTLKILSGLIPRFDGQLRIQGKDLRRQRGQAHRLIGYCPQAAGFQLWRTADSALRSLGQLSGVSRADLDARIPALLERFDLLAVRYKKIKKLSGGMVQKLALIQALLHQPKLLLLDEPLAGLDPVSRNLVKDVVRDCRSSGTTVLFSSHILSDVQDVADRLGILYGGKLITAGSIPELKQEFGGPVDVAVTLSAVPEDTSFLSAHEQVDAVQQSSPEHWRLRLAPGADSDAVIHSLIEEILNQGGRLRHIGPVDPNLDDLYFQYIQAAHEKAHASARESAAHP